MARRRTDTRPSSGKREARARRTTGRGKVVRGSAEASPSPGILLGAVKGIEPMAMGAFQFGRDVLVSAVSQAVSIGTGALTVAATGARGLASAASRVAGGFVGSAQDIYQETLAGAKPSPARARRPRSARPRIAA